MRFLPITLAVFAAAWLTLMPEKGQAQVLNPGRSIIQDQFFNKPTVSPYLNLLRNQGLGLPNYQQIVRPQVEQRRASQQQGRAISQLQQQQAQQTAQLRGGTFGLQPTGHVSLFMQYSHYYRGLGAASAAGGIQSGFGR